MTRKGSVKAAGLNLIEKGKFQSLKILTPSYVLEDSGIYLFDRSSS